MAIFRTSHWDLSQSSVVMLETLMNCRDVEVWPFFLRNRLDIFAVYSLFLRLLKRSIFQEWRGQGIREIFWWVLFAFCKINWICDRHRWGHFYRDLRCDIQRSSWIHFCFGCHRCWSIYFMSVLIMFQVMHLHTVRIVNYLFFFIWRKWVWLS